jgi:hypothetical protein
MLARKMYSAGAVFLALFISLYYYFFFRVEHVTQLVESVATRISSDDDPLRASQLSYAATRMSPKWQFSKYVWAFGLAANCVGVYSPLILWAGRNDNDSSAYANVSGGDLVWVFANDTHHFLDNVLPSIRYPFVLMISGGDDTFPKDLLSHDDLQKLLGNRNLIHVFAQNLDGRQLPQQVLKKISHVPIGYDFHTPAYKQWPSTNVTEEEAMLNDLIDHMPERSKRKLRIHADFQYFDSMRMRRWRDFNGIDRTWIFNTINATGLVDYSSGRLGRQDTYRAKTQYIFSASPPGNGIDCHRTWESLLLGNIVIVMETGLEPMFEGLPVVVVKNWTEVSRKNLVLWEKRFRNMPYESYRHMLTNKYWLDQMTKVATAFMNGSKVVISPSPLQPTPQVTTQPSRAPTHMSPKWQFSKYVWAFGLAANCVGVYSPLRLWAGTEDYDTNVQKRLYANVSGGDIAWVFPYDTHHFLDEVLPSIRYPFVLMISGEDDTFPKDLLSHDDLQKLLGNRNLIHVFAQNFDGRHLPQQVLEKISHVPIGYDFHTPAYKQWPSTNVTEEEAMLNDLIDHMPERSKRKLRIHADFQYFDSMRMRRWRDFNGIDRTWIFNTINATGLVDYSSGRLGRQDTYRAKTQYIFSASPPGNGIDCHRTWESLLLGNIVIVMETGLEPMFEGLPVVVVKNWTEVSQENLVLWEKRFRNMPYESYRHMLTNKYWLDQMTKVAAPFKSKLMSLRSR